MPMKPIFLINGPNLDLLGQRQPEIYGSETLADVERICRAAADPVEIVATQSSHEGEIVEIVHRARLDGSGIVINAGAYSHTSIAILDALNAFDGPVIEVHVSNIHAREAFRHHSMISARADGVIVGCGIQGYEFAVRRLVSIDTPR